MTYGSSIGLLLGNIIHAADVFWARRLHRRPHFLPVLLLFVTWQCNRRCSMCGVSRIPSPLSEPELSLEEYVAVFRSARRLGTRLMLVSGGEALTRGPMLFDLIASAREHGIATHLCTNGGLVTDETAERLQECGTQSISVSLESPEPAVNDRIRGAGSYIQAIEALSRFRRLAPRIHLGVNCTITALNFRGVASMIPFAESLGVHQIKFAPVHVNLLHQHKEKGDFGELLFQESQLPELRAEMRALSAAVRKTRLLATSPYFINQIPDSLWNRRLTMCFAGYSACAMDPYGYISPCPDIATSLSVRKRPLDAWWRSEEFDVLRHRVDACDCRCWDALFAEMSLRLGDHSLWDGLWRTLRSFTFYYGKPRS